MEEAQMKNRETLCKAKYKLGGKKSIQFYEKKNPTKNNSKITSYKIRKINDT